MLRLGGILKQVTPGRARHAVRLIVELELDDDECRELEGAMRRYESFVRELEHAQKEHKTPATVTQLGHLARGTFGNVTNWLMRDIGREEEG